MMLKFSDFPYNRPDVDELRASYANLTKRFEAAASAEEDSTVPSEAGLSAVLLHELRPSRFGIESVDLGSADERGGEAQTKKASPGRPPGEAWISRRRRQEAGVAASAAGSESEPAGSSDASASDSGGSSASPAVRSS